MAGCGPKMERKWSVVEGKIVDVGTGQKEAGRKQFHVESKFLEPAKILVEAIPLETEQPMMIKISCD